MKDTGEVRSILINLDKIVAESGKKATLIAAVTARALMLRRINQDGKKTDGSRMGSYSTKLMYLSVDKYMKKNPLLGSGVAASLGSALAAQERFKNGKSRKSLKLEGGYAQLKSLTGKNSRLINLNNSGELSDSIIVGSFKRKATLGFLNKRNANKADYLEKRFGQVFSPSETEIKLSIDAAIDVIRKESDKL